MSLWDNIKERFSANKLLGLSRDVLKLSNNMMGGSEEGFFSKLGNSMKNAMMKVKAWVSKKSDKNSDVALNKEVRGLVSDASGLVSGSKQFRAEVSARRAEARAEERAKKRQAGQNARDSRASARTKQREERKKGAVAGAPEGKLSTAASRMRNNASNLRKLAETPGIDSKDAKKLTEMAAGSDIAAAKLAEVKKLAERAKVRRVEGMRVLLTKQQEMRRKPTPRPGKGPGQDQGPTVG